MIGAKLRQVRERRGLSQTFMGEYLDMTAAGYARYEKGTSDPSLENLKKLCEFFEITSDWLLGINGSQTIKSQAELLKATLTLKNARASVAPVTLRFPLEDGSKSEEEATIIVINGITLQQAIREIIETESLIKSGSLSKEVLGYYLDSKMLELNDELYVEATPSNIAQEIAELITQKQA